MNLIYLDGINKLVDMREIDCRGRACPCPDREAMIVIVKSKLPVKTTPIIAFSNPGRDKPCPYI